MKGAGVEPRPVPPLAGMITITLPSSRLLKPENCKTYKALFHKSSFVCCILITVLLSRVNEC